MTANNPTDHPPHGAPTPAPLRIAAGDQLTIYTVSQFGTMCRARLAEASELTVDLGGVTSCDTLGIQVLWAARRSAEATGKTLRFINVSDAVSQAASEAGCESLFRPTRSTP